MRDFVSSLVNKMVTALELPIRPEYTKDIDLLLCINTYGDRTLNRRREKALLLTFMALMDCHNNYENVLSKVKELSDSFGFLGVKTQKESSIKTYRSNILSKILTFRKEDLPECAFKWREKVMKELI
jgi:hypothetical protein